MQDVMDFNCHYAMGKITFAINSAANLAEANNDMLNKISEILDKQLELERLRFQKTAAVSQKQSEFISSYSQGKNDSNFKRKGSEVKTVNSKRPRKEESGQNDEIRKELDEIKRNLEDKNLSKVSVKRDYKLTQNSNLDLWTDRLRSELLVNDMLVVIDSPNSSNATLKRKGLVRDIIISHLDEHYHKKIFNETDLIVILNKIKEYKRGEKKNVTHSSDRAEIYSLTYDPKDKIFNFIEKFDGIVRDYENMERAIQFTEPEKRAAFYKAVSGAFPELRSADLLKRQTSSEMTLDEIKSFLLQLEAEKRGDQREDVRAHRDRSFVQTKKPEEKCHRCNRVGHWRNECPFEGTEFWFCYWCKKIQPHNGTECPSPDAVQFRRQNQRYSNNKVTNSLRGSYESRGNGRSRGKSGFRGNKSRGNFNNQNSQNQNNENKNNYNKINVRGRGGRLSKEKQITT